MIEKRPSYFQRLREQLTEEPDQESYMGNIWGWKFSIFGLILILLFVGLLVYRYLVLGVSINETEASPFYQPDEVLPQTEQVEEEKNE